MNNIQNWFIKNNINVHQTKSDLYLIRTLEILNNLSKQCPNPKQILDMGCGYGYNTCLLSKYFPEAKIDAIDYGRDKISIWEKIITEIKPNIEFKSGDARNTNLLTEKYDVVIMWGLLEHLGEEQFSQYKGQAQRSFAEEQETLCLNEIHRLLKDKGILYICYLPNEESWIENLTKHTNLYSHTIKLTPLQISNLLITNNFLPKKINYTHFYPSLYFILGNFIGTLLNKINPLLNTMERLIHRTPLTKYSQDLEIIALKIK